MTEQPTFKFALRDDLQDDKHFLPVQAEPKASGWDVRAAFRNGQSLILRPFQVAKIPLGFRAFCPEGWWYDLKPRSSTFAKKNLHCLYGTVDETYEGELIFACQYIPPVSYSEEWDEDGEEKFFVPERWDEYCSSAELKIEFGEAIGQIIPRQRQLMTVEEVTNEQYEKLVKARAAVRGAGGFGSTGK